MDEPNESLPDGRYEVMVVDVEHEESDLPELSLVILTGTFKGQVVTIGQPSIDEMASLLLGRLGRLEVTDKGMTLALEN